MWEGGLSRPNVLSSQRGKSRRRRYRSLGEFTAVLEACRRQEFVGEPDHSLKYPSLVREPKIKLRSSCLEKEVIFFNFCEDARVAKSGKSSHRQGQITAGEGCGSGGSKCSRQEERSTGE